MRTAELINSGNAQLKTPPNRITKNNLLKARHYFSQALHYLQQDNTTTPKQVARVCQKLLETELGLSQVIRAHEERIEHAAQAQKYGEVALENVMKAGDGCMAAQVEFLLACTTVWKVYLRVRSSQPEHGESPEAESAQLLLFQRLERLREYPRLPMDYYEEQVRTYAGYLTSA